MKDLLDTIQSFGEREIEIYKKLYGSSNPKVPNKPESLFDYLLENKNANEREVIKVLYGKSKSAASAFSHLKKKLQTQLSVVLIAWDTEMSLDSNDTDYNTILRMVTRLYLTRAVLIKKRVNSVMNNMIREIYKYAKQYEIFDFWAIAILEIVGQDASKGEKFLAKQSDELDKVLNNFCMYNKGEMLLWQLTPAMYLKNKENEFIEQGRKTVATLKKHSKDSQSDLILMTQLEGEMFLAEFERRQKDVLTLARQRYALATTSKALNKKGIIRATRNQLIIALINNHLFEEADEWAYKYLNEIPKDVMIVYADNAFRAALYSKNFKHCNEYLELYKKSPQFIKNEQHTTYYYYYKAALAFYQKNFDEVFEHLSKTSWMLRDKTGWGLGVKLMEILAYIEIGQFEMVMFRIKALWQLLYRNQNKNIARTKTISHVLYALLQSGFNYRKVLEKEKQKISDLRDSNGIYYWDPSGQEVVRFDWWFDEKMKRVR